MKWNNAEKGVEEMDLSHWIQIQERSFVLNSTRDFYAEMDPYWVGWTLRNDLLQLFWVGLSTPIENIATWKSHGMNLGAQLVARNIYCE